MKGCLRTLILVIVITSFGCGPTITINEETVNAQLEFLKEEFTSKFDVQTIFGEPHHEYENGQTIIYLMCPGGNGQLEPIIKGRCSIDEKNEDDFWGLWVAGRPMDKVIAVYNLVLVFNEKDVLIKHNLLRIK